MQKPACKNLNCNAAGDCEITSDASFKDFEDFNSPSAAMTFALASLAASASAAIALCNVLGKITSLISKRSTFFKGETNNHYKATI